jgi:hypothetical protein
MPMSTSTSSLTHRLTRFLSRLPIKTHLPDIQIPSIRQDLRPGPHTREILNLCQLNINQLEVARHSSCGPALGNP